nr:hypothetical protein [Tanacetum cinerariifolium]
MVGVALVCVEMVAGSNGGCCGWQLGWWCGAVGSAVGMVVTVGGSGCCHG